MLKRRTFSKFGLVGSTAAFATWSTHTAAASPSTTPFLDRLPLPPPPKALAWSPDSVPPLDGLPTEANGFIDRTHQNGKATFYRIDSEVRSVQFHSELRPTEIWGYRDANMAPGTAWNYALGPTFKAYKANNLYSPVIVRHTNRLPAHREHVGFGEPRSSVHLHGGHSSARSDGYPTDIVHPDGTTLKVTFEHGEHFDYVYPMVTRGALDDRRDGTTHQAVPTERSSTLWYHDHIIDFTSQNVYRGLAGFFLVYDSPYGADGRLLPLDQLGQIRDTGDETNAAGAPRALQLPSGEFDIPLVLHEKSFGANGELVYDVFNLDGFLGDKYLVNGMVQPYLPVKRRKYRFRFLNGSNARIYQLFLADASGKTYPMTQIATEGGLLARPVARPSFHLAMAERVEVVIDFSKFAHPQFTEVYIENRLIQTEGRGPSGKYEKPGLASRGTRLLKFKLEEALPDPSFVGKNFGAGLELRPFAVTPAAELSNAPIRNFIFERGNGQWQVNGQLAGDLSRVMARPRGGHGEIWRLINKSGGWWHPIHIHLEFVRVLKRNGKVPFDGFNANDFGQSVERDGMARKDTISLGPNSEVEVFVKFRDHKGPYVLHCHNMEHEDHAMMARFDII
jgi:FtsP/CotA-like multicopper oxidase with cupredoxin domain